MDAMSIHRTETCQFTEQKHVNSPNAIAGGKYALGGERIRHREGGRFRRIGGKPQSYPIMHSRV